MGNLSSSSDSDPEFEEKEALAEKPGQMSSQKDMLEVTADSSVKKSNQDQSNLEIQADLQKMEISKQPTDLKPKDQSETPDKSQKKISDLFQPSPADSEQKAPVITLHEDSKSSIDIVIEEKSIETLQHPLSLPELAKCSSDEKLTFRMEIDFSAMNKEEIFRYQS